jgi:protein-tyrosine-phosphatase
MTNQEILNKWNECSYGNLDNFDISNIYSIMFVEKDNDVDDFLSLFGLTSEQLINSKDKQINSSLENIDCLMMDTSYILRDFIVNYVFVDSHEDDVMDGYRSSVEDLREIYEEVESELKKIKNRVNDT